MNQPQDIFPTEIWESLIDQLQCSQDRHAILLASPSLSYEFHRSKPKWLFEQVLPLLSSYLISRKKLLTLRLVCKHWDQSIHNCISDHPCHQPYNQDGNNGLPINTTDVNQNCTLFKLATLKPVLRFRTVGQLNLILECSSTTRFLKSPIFGNRVSFDPSIATQNCREMYQQASLNFLKQHGSIIKHLTVTSHKMIETTPQFYKRLRLSLELTPNVQSLSILFHNQKDTKLLKLLIPRRPLPPLPQLKCLKFRSCNYSEPQNISDVILSYVTGPNSTIRKLSISDSCKDLFSRYYQVGGKLKNLSELEILDYDLGKGVHSLLTYLSFDNNLQKISIASRRVFYFSKFLERYSKLDVFVLDLTNVLDLSISENKIFTNLQHLHTLKLRDSTFVSYTFLHNFVSLRYLEIKQANKEPLMGRKLVYCNFEPRTRKWDASNKTYTCITQKFHEQIYNWVEMKIDIWRMVPKLERIAVSRKLKGSGWIRSEYMSCESSKDLLNIQKLLRNTLVLALGRSIFSCVCSNLFENWCKHTRSYNIT